MRNFFLKKQLAIFSFLLLFFPAALKAEEVISAQQAPAAQAQEGFLKKIKQAEDLAQKEKWSEAQKAGREINSSTLTEKDKLRLAKLLRDARYHLLFSKEKTETSEIYQVQPGDSLGKIAKQYKTTIELIRKANSLKRDVIQPGQKLKIEKEPFSAEISIKKNTLWLKQGKYDVKKYRVSTGEKGNTPVGDFKIANKVVSPTWYYENKVIPPGDPQNGLGTRWLGFDLKGYGIHGTIEPEKIGQPASLGCVRMLNDDVEELFDLLPIGTVVRVRKN